MIGRICPDVKLTIIKFSNFGLEKIYQGAFGKHTANTTDYFEFKT